jgi:hypothetical protein
VDGSALIYNELNCALPPLLGAADIFGMDEDSMAWAEKIPERDDWAARLLVYEELPGDEGEA